MKNKQIIIGVIILLVIGGGVFTLFTKNSSNKSATNQLQFDQEIIPKISPSDLGLVMTLRSDKKAIKFEITKIEGIESVDYQISYTKDVNGEEVPEGLIGEVKVNPEDTKIEIKYREFGTCSSGVCRYDRVISPVKLTLKITKQDGKIYQAEDSVEL